jgi:hypothetical protein
MLVGLLKCKGTGGGGDSTAPDDVKSGVDVNNSYSRRNRSSHDKEYGVKIYRGQEQLFEEQN